MKLSYNQSKCIFSLNYWSYQNNYPALLFFMIQPSVRCFIFTFLFVIIVILFPLKCKLHKYKEFVLFCVILPAFRKYLAHSWVYNKHLLNYFYFFMDSSRVVVCFWLNHLFKVWSIFSHSDHLNCEGLIYTIWW